ncbi:glycosyltransferase [Streptococcus sp. DD12]|uniref:glycosyltransferase n=1 Tax=Streptococcus sp. DD12 TaxID=1777880 RepID=UPI000793235F|nr:glycosyltransferase [Streptococcus sp. DD12]KXT75576.1 Glycosyltransferase LafB, responsible for the formation of Gal-Glc-DAG [Streptococcus sp. DD12]
MKVLLYLEAENVLGKSGVGRAIKHQERALTDAGVSYTRNPKETYDIAHINTYFLKSFRLLQKSKKEGKKVIMHGHSTKEDFEHSFIGSTAVAPLFKWWLCQFYKRADAIITPTAYSRDLIASYGISCPIYPVSNGIELGKYQPNSEKEAIFRQHFGLSPKDKVVICAGLYFERKGIEDFVKVASKMPDVRFIWFGESPLWQIPRKIRRLVTKDHPKNVTFAGYIKGAVFEGAMSGSDCFFFPSHEETEGIVVLEALASHQHVLVRDIPVYQGWLDEINVEMAKDVSGFVDKLQVILSGQSQKQEAGYEVAKAKAIDIVGQELVSVYQKVMED